MKHNHENSRSPHCRDPRRGFSLIEALVTVVLLGILAATVIPYFGTQIPSQLEGVAQIVAADLDYARNLAIANGSSYRITFQPDNNRYVLEHTGPNNLLEALPSSAFRLPTDPADKQTTALDELPLSQPRVAFLGATLGSSTARVNSLEFTSLGGTSSPQEVALWLACGSGSVRRYLAVRVSPITGLAEIGEVQAIAPTIGT